MRPSLLWFAWLWLFFSGCSGSKHEPSYGYAPQTGSSGGDSYDYDDAESEKAEDYRRESTALAESRGRPSKAAPSAAPPPPSAPMTMDAPMQPVDVSMPAEPTPAPTVPAPSRMVHYDGWMQLRVANPRETLELAVKKAEEMGGRTERMSGNTVTLRVPVERFEEAWAALLTLGDAMNKSIRADDVTEAFTAMDLRADTLRAMQKRLVALLAKAKDEEEKLRLLAELTRVTTELDALESQLRTLKDLASMSRITLEAHPREAFQAQGGRPALDGFAWITSLSPFRRSIWDDDHRVELDVPQGLVALSQKGPFVAESADGVVLWTMRLQNDPVGSAPFWLASVQDRLAKEFTSPQPARIRDWECLSLAEPGAEDPYRWQICVRTDGNKLHIAQVFYPSKAQFDRYGAAVEAVLSAGGES